MRIDLVMLERLASVKAVGLYAAATRLSELFYLAPMIVGRAAFPRMVRLRESSPAQYQKFYYLSLAAMVGIAAIMIIGVQLFGNFAILTLYGPKFAGATSSFIIHIWTTLPVCIGIAVSNSYQIEGETRPQMWACIIGAIANTLLNFHFIPAYGPAGAALATITAQTLAVFSPILLSRRCREIALGRHIRTLQPS
jgi:PST family polysaccharide transporter